MARHLTKEEKDLIFRKYMDKYLQRDDLVDFSLFVKNTEEGAPKKMDAWLDWAKENLSSEEYQKFVSKICPFEPNKDRSDVQEKEELKQRVAQIAEDVCKGEAGLIDIIDNITDSPNKYLYMCKQLRFKYALIGARVFESNNEFYHMISSYKKTNSEVSISYPNISSREKVLLEEIIASRNLPLNNITYREAYKYAKRQGLLKESKNIKK